MSATWASALPFCGAPASSTTGRGRPRVARRLARSSLTAASSRRSASISDVCAQAGEAIKARAARAAAVIVVLNMASHCTLPQTPDMRRTKILATLGPASSDAAVIRALIDAGADAFRLNFSHGTAEAHAALCRLVRAEAKAAGCHVLVLQDLGGPKIRTGPLAAPMTLSRGDVLIIDQGHEAGEHGRITTSFAPLFSSVAPGQKLLLDDGRLSLTVSSVAPGRLTTTVDEGGVLDSRKGINVPGGAIRTAALTDKD